MKYGILPVCLVVALWGTLGLAQDTKDRPASTRVDGAWRLVTQKNGELKEQTAVPDDERQIKLLADGRYSWTWFKKDGKVLFGLGGRYTIEGDKYIEHIEYAIGDEFAQFVGKSAEFKSVFEAGKWRHKGVVKVNGMDYTIDEVWERLK